MTYDWAGLMAKIKDLGSSAIEYGHTTEEAAKAIERGEMTQEEATDLITVKDGLNKLAADAIRFTAQLARTFGSSVEEERLLEIVQSSAWNGN